MHLLFGMRLAFEVEVHYLWSFMERFLQKGFTWMLTEAERRKYD